MTIWRIRNKGIEPANKEFNFWRNNDGDRWWMLSARQIVSEMRIENNVQTSETKGQMTTVREWTRRAQKNFKGAREPNTDVA